MLDDQMNELSHWRSYSGTGTANYTNGDKYEGDFVDGKRTGKGTLTWANGDKYKGDFVDGKRTGEGTFTSGTYERAPAVAGAIH